MFSCQGVTGVRGIREDGRRTVLSDQELFKIKGLHSVLKREKTVLCLKVNEVDFLSTVNIFVCFIFLIVRLLQFMLIRLENCKKKHSYGAVGMSITIINYLFIYLILISLLSLLYLFLFVFIYL